MKSSVITCLTVNDHSPHPDFASCFFLPAFCWLDCKLVCLLELKLTRFTASVYLLGCLHLGQGQANNITDCASMKERGLRKYLSLLPPAAYTAKQPKRRRSVEQIVTVQRQKRELPDFF